MKKTAQQFPFRMALILALMVFGLSAVVAYGAGFISYENGNTVILWDDVQVLDGGMLVADAIFQGVEMPAAGNVQVSGRDIDVRGGVGFCTGYNKTLEKCSALIGDIGDSKAVQTRTIANDQQLTIQNTTSNGISLFSGSPNGSIELSGTMKNTGGNIASTKDFQSRVSTVENTALADTVQANVVKNVTKPLQLGGAAGVQAGSEVFDVSRSDNNFQLQQ